LHTVTYKTLLLVTEQVQQKSKIIIVN